MIECVFTIDYEIYGNGEGSLKDLVYSPAKRLKDVFETAEAKLVVFVEAAEMERIAASGSDSAIGDVERQIQELYDQGHEIALHLHPQWTNARYQNGKWVLDYKEYNLCTLSEDRISEIVTHAIGYLQQVLKAPDYRPLSFRAGNWLFQPTQPAATVLSGIGIKIDSSVFKGGQQRDHNLDYRRALRNGPFWRFQDRVEIPDPRGELFELPIYTKMVPFWKMLTNKRINLQQKGAASSRNEQKKNTRYLDFLRFFYPLKLDFCRLTLKELTQMVEKATIKDRENPNIIFPLVAIGHTKDLVDLETVEGFLAYLNQKSIPISTFKEIYEKGLPVIG